MIFETHAHYEDAAFDEDRRELLESLPEHNIEYVVNISSSIKTVDESINLAQNYNYICFCWYSPGSPC